jgi:hypothetical protein
MEWQFRFHSIKNTFFVYFRNFFDEMTPNYWRTDTIFLLGIPVYILLTYIRFKANTKESSNMIELKTVGHSSTPYSRYIGIFLIRLSEREREKIENCSTGLPEPKELKRPNLATLFIKAKISKKRRKTNIFSVNREVNFFITKLWIWMNF